LSFSTPELTTTNSFNQVTANVCRSSSNHSSPTSSKPEQQLLTPHSTAAALAFSFASLVPHTASAGTQYLRHAQ